MVGIGIQMLQIPFEWLELAFERFESCSNGWNWHLNASNAFLMGWIGMQFELCSNGSNLHSNASNPVLMVGILFECLESRSNGWNLHSNPVRMIWICIQMVRISFEWFEFAFKWFKSRLNAWKFAFECFETRSNGWNLHSSASNTVQKVEFALSALNPFEWLELAFECFESRSIVRIGIRMVQILFGNFHSNGSNLVRLGKIFLESACYTIFTVLRNFLGLVHAFVTV